MVAALCVAFAVRYRQCSLKLLSDLEYLTPQRSCEVIAVVPFGVIGVGADVILLEPCLKFFPGECAVIGVCNTDMRIRELSLEPLPDVLR